MRKMIICSVILILVITFVFALFSVKVDIPLITEDAIPLEYKEITGRYEETSRFTFRSFLLNRVEIQYLDGHNSDNTIIMLKNSKPYESFDIYVIEDVLVLFYQESKKGKSEDRYFILDGMPGVQNEDDIQVIKNNKHIMNIIVDHAIE